MIIRGIVLACDLIAVGGLAAVLAGAAAVQRFARRIPRHRAALPPVTVMKPLSGDEPLLEEALATICRQTYPEFQVVFGVQDPADPALQAIARLRARFPDCDIAVTIGPSSQGPNHKVCNLINMLPAARHDILVFSDSDMHVPAGYLDNVVANLFEAGVGLVTTLCVGRPTVPGLTARMGAMQITHSFLPGVLLARALGRQDCLGTTMAIRRDTLRAIGGLEALVGHLADDNVLGQLVRRAGFIVALADTVPATAVAERAMKILWLHELRWTRTIRGLEPTFLATSVVQFPLFWSAAAMLISGFAVGPIGIFAGAWLVRIAAAVWIDRALELPRELAGRALLLPARDILSAIVVIASFFDDTVVWRGRSMIADRSGSLPTR